jgi:chemotaxis protein MotB
MDKQTELINELSESQDWSWMEAYDHISSLRPAYVPHDPDPFTQIDMPKTLHWSVPWSDLMMTMFILFAILFVYHTSEQNLKITENPTVKCDFVVSAEPLFSKPDSRRNASPEISEPDPQRISSPKIPEPGTLRNASTEISELYEMGQRTLKAEDLKDVASVELVENKAVRIILTSDVFFDLGESDLKPEAIESLHKVTGILKETQHAINVVGHTDDVPIHTERFPSNWELSAARACVTARFIIREIGISPDQIFVSGHAEYEPVKANDTPKGRQANRRVEIIITKEKPMGIAQKSMGVSNSGRGSS